MSLTGKGTSRRGGRIWERRMKLTTVRASRESVDRKKLASISCKCTFGCTAKVNAEERMRIFKDFYKLASHDEQNKYLLGLISRS